jgi:hypothetical protein
MGAILLLLSLAYVRVVRGMIMLSVVLRSSSCGPGLLNVERVSFAFILSSQSAPQAGLDCITTIDEKGPCRAFPYQSTQAPKMPVEATQTQFWTCGGHLDLLASLFVPDRGGVSLFPTMPGRGDVSSCIWGTRLVWISVACRSCNPGPRTHKKFSCKKSRGIDPFPLGYTCAAVTPPNLLQKTVPYRPRIRSSYGLGYGSPVSPLGGGANSGGVSQPVLAQGS